MMDDGVMKNMSAGRPPPTRIWGLTARLLRNRLVAFSELLIGTMRLYRIWTAKYPRGPGRRHTDCLPSKTLRSLVL